MNWDRLYNEKDLFRQISEDDETAFATIFDYYFGHLYRVMFTYTLREADAEDIVQQVFVKVWENRRQLKAVQNPSAWLFKLAQNEFISRFRKLRSSQQYRRYLAHTMTAQEHFSPEDMLICKQQETLLRQAISQLSPQQQKAYLLSRERGLTYAEIAIEMGLGQTTVKEHISRALKTIRQFVAANYTSLWLGCAWIAASFFH